MNASLRLRLVIIILVPLLVIAGILAAWAFYDAQGRANERFDRSLLSAALAVSRDVGLSGGDALSPETNALLRDTSGGQVFYHAYAPDGVFVTGYATPPIPGVASDSPQSGQVYFDALYQGEDVRALRYSDVMLIDGLNGEFTFTVWQTADQRRAIARDMAWRTFQVISSLIVAVALIVWFGVRYGLRPLLSLEAAIARRNPGDLDPIQRQVPTEAKGIVATLNRLFGQLDDTMQAKDAFISNAAHQLRNPIAGVVAMSEALQSAKTFEDMKDRSAGLIEASKRTGDLANKLLAYDRIATGQHRLDHDRFDCRNVVSEVKEELAAKAHARDVQLTADQPEAAAWCVGDRTMVKEAIKNLVENALLHGGAQLSAIHLATAVADRHVTLTVRDNGRGIPADQMELARERFGQVYPSEGSGLGLAIADAVATTHGGRLIMTEQTPGLAVALEFPTRT